MPREQGLKPIGDSIKKIIERIKKERDERRRKGKPIRTQPKLPGMMSGGMGIFSKRKRVEASEPDPKGKNKSNTTRDNLTKKKKRLEELRKELGMKKGGLKGDPSKAIRSVKPALGRKKTEEFLRKLKDKKKKMGGGMLRYNKGGGADSGTKGEARSKVYSYARKMKDKDRLTQRDIEKAKKMKGLKKGGSVPEFGPGKAPIKQMMKNKPRSKKRGFPDLSGDGKTTMKDVLIGRGVIKKKSGGSIKKKSRKNPMKDDRAREGLKSKYRKMGFGKMIDSGEIDFSKYKKGGSIDKNVRVIDLQKQGKTSKKGIRVKGKGKSFMDVYKKTVYNRADGGMVPFGGEKRVPGSGAATRGTGFKGIF